MHDSLRKITQDVVACRACPRLVTHREQIAREKRRAYQAWEYWGRPVPGFGDPGARLVLVGLAPGAHGSNRTGRMFTGDASGQTLFSALHLFGFSSAPQAISRDDGLSLQDCYITAAARCAPPGNRPAPQELQRCFPFLVRELRCLPRARVYLGLGRVGFEALWRALLELGVSRPDRKPVFGHGAEFEVKSEATPAIPRSVLCSYHPSQQNTQTGRLTPRMFHQIFRRAARILRET